MKLLIRSNDEIVLDSDRKFIPWCYRTGLSNTSTFATSEFIPDNDLESLLGYPSISMNRTPLLFMKSPGIE